MLVLLAYAAAAPMVRLENTAAARALPVGLAVVLTGLLVLVTRRKVLSQIAGFLLLDNGITAIARSSPRRAIRCWSSSASPSTCCSPCSYCAFSVPGCARASAPPTSTTCGSCTTDEHPPVRRPDRGPPSWSRCSISPPDGAATAHAATAASAIILAAAIALAVKALRHGPIHAASGWLRADALTAFMLLGIGAIALIACFAGPGYLASHEGESDRLRRRYGVLVSLFLAAMSTAVLAGHLGLAWIAIEATSIVTAFLAGHADTRTALEAAWKYTVICSTGTMGAMTALVRDYAGTSGAGPPTAIAAPVVVWIFKMRLDGHTLARIVRALNDAANGGKLPIRITV